MAYGGAEPVFQKVTLKSWLYSQIQSGEYRGLEWENPDIMTFRLPWVKETDPHSDDFYKLFHAWSQRDSKLPCESSKAKRNFRSALNHSKHFEEIGREDKQTGSYKIYQFKLSQQEMADMRTLNRSNITGNVCRNAASPFSCTNDVSCPSFTLYANQQQISNRYQTAGVNDLNIMKQMYRKPVPIEHEMNMNIVADDSMSHTNSFSDNGSRVNIGSVTCPKEVCVDVDMASIPSFDSDRAISITLKSLGELGISREDLASCEYTIEYLGMYQRMGFLRNMENNSKFIFGSLEHAKTVERVNLHKKSRYYSVQWHFLEEPIPNNSKRLMTILEHMDTGISIWFDVRELCIKVVRHCLTQVFSFDIVGSNDCLTLLERNKEYSIFSFHQFLSNRITSSMVSEVIPPDAKVELIAGVRPEEKGALSKGVKIILKPCGALKLLNRDDKSSLQGALLSFDASSLDMQVRAMSLNNNQLR